MRMLLGLVQHAPLVQPQGKAILAHGNPCLNCIVFTFRCMLLQFTIIMLRVVTGVPDASAGHSRGCQPPHGRGC